MDLKAYLDEKRGIVEEALMRLAPQPHGPAGEVRRAMSYSLFAGGKRLRPILCMAGAGAVGGNEQGVLPVACALEMIHTYSLIHDDLPAMDDDDLRRGKPTCHKVYGEALAILAGDALLTEAFELMTHTDLSKGLEPRLLLKVMALIAGASGCDGMVGGQVVDIHSEGKAVDRSLVEFIHTHKTGALIAASVSSVAILGGGNQEQVKAITSYGQVIGLAFQIADDVLDVEGDSDAMGKRAGADARKKKITYPSVLGLKESKAIQNRLVEKALDPLKSFDQKADPLRHLAMYIVERKK